LQTQPLRRRLLLLVVAAILPLALLAGVALLTVAQAQRAQLERAGLEIARALSTAVDAELERSLAAVRALTVSQALDEADLSRFHSATAAVLKLDPTWLTVLLADPSGRLLSDASVPFGGPLGQTVERESFERAVRTRQVTIGHLAPGKSGAYAVPLRVPVLREDAVRYVLTAVVKPDGIREVLERQRVPPDWVVSVFDGKDKRVARSRQHAENLGTDAAPSLKEMMAQGGEEGAGLTRALEGDEVYTAYSRSRESGWSVAIGIPAAAVDAAVWRSVATYGAGILLTIALGVLAAVIIGRSITRPIEALAGAARALGRGEPMAPPATPIAEISHVAESLHAAAAERARGEAERDRLLAREQQARAVAEEANRSKDTFLAMLGHELRNPLAAIANASHLLGVPEESVRSQARAVVDRQVRHLARMTDDLLDAARAMTGKIVLQRETLDLAEAAARALATLRATGQAGGRRIEQRLEAAWINADATRIEQIISNLLGNAIKYTPPEGAIRVSVERQGGDAVLRVADDGAGMSAELARRVFDPFVQGERPLDRTVGGLGVGLTLVRRLAELHGGAASMHSDGPGRGSEATVRFPALNAPAEAPPPAAAVPAVSRDVLVVEDNDDAREMLRGMLELDGHRVRVAADGAAGLEAVRADVPELAFIDIGLPKMDGYELARRIRSELGAARRPYLVAITGYGLPEDRRRTREAGFDLHLVKPVDHTAIAAVLRASG